MVTDLIDVVEMDLISGIQYYRWILDITIWKPYKEKQYSRRPVKRWIDDLDDYWKGTIWQRIAQDREMWKQHAEAFAQPRDTMTAQ